MVNSTSDRAGASLVEQPASPKQEGHMSWSGFRMLIGAGSVAAKKTVFPATRYLLTTRWFATRFPEAVASIPASLDEYTNGYIVLFGWNISSERGHVRQICGAVVL